MYTWSHIQVNFPVLISRSPPSPKHIYESFIMEMMVVGAGCMLKWYEYGVECAKEVSSGDDGSDGTLGIGIGWHRLKQHRWTHSIPDWKCTRICILGCECIIIILIMVYKNFLTIALFNIIPYLLCTVGSFSLHIWLWHGLIMNILCENIRIGNHLYTKNWEYYTFSYS